MIATLSSPSASALIVDRDRDTRQMYATSLRLAHFDVDEADEGREALAKALGRRYAILIMDTRLPGLDGYQLTRLLRRDPMTQALPIVVVTGEGTASATERARKCGANTVLVKPVTPDALLAEVRRLLDAPATPTNLANAAEQPPSSGRMGHILSRAHRRGETIAPPIQPPVLICPRCDTALVYQRSYVGGVSAKHSEQWDEYECPNGCGSFQYRHRTKKIRPLTAGDPPSSRSA